MNYFNKYSSNTYASSANQHVFRMDKSEIRTGRVFYKITNGGAYNYSLLFSNIIDSTYADGSVSYKNLVCDEWEIVSARVGKCKSEIFGEDFIEEQKTAEINDSVTDFIDLTFDGKKAKNVSPGEFFYCDEFLFDVNKNDYLCLEITFKGEIIPYHEESLLPIFKKTENGWIYSREMPLCGMVGCDRSVDKKIAFVGDSITQGIGTEPNSYKHWNALLSERLSGDNSYWNLGIGYARADDFASGGAWFYKAKNCDIAFVCFGVNDLIRGFTGEQVINNLEKIIECLKKENIKIILQTVPPFDYGRDKIEAWKKVNEYILTVLKSKVDYVFDNRYVLGVSEELLHMAKYGGHPNAEGSKIWADALYNEVNEILK